MRDEPIDPLVAVSRRQATATVAGYAYQIWRSVYEWIRLRPGEALYLEGAEDVDLLGPNKAETIQVKAGSRTVTLSSPDIVEAIIHFWEHRKNNPGVDLRYRFLTPALRGTEQASPFGNERGLDYWDRARRENVDLEPLRSFLSTRIAVFESSVATEILEFLEKGSDQMLRDQLIRSITWDTGAETQSEIEEWVTRRVIELSAHMYLAPPVQGEKAVPHLLDRAWRATSNQTRRWLYLSDAHEILQHVLSENIPRHVLQHYRALEAGIDDRRPGTSSLRADSLGSIRIFSQLYPLSEAEIVPRATLVGELHQQLMNSGLILLHGSTGMGKSTLARLIAAHGKQHWELLDFRGQSAEQIRQRLLRAVEVSSEMASGTGVILDDLNFDVAAITYENILAEFIYLVRTKSGSIIVTSQGHLPTQVKARLTIGDVLTITVPPLTPDEISIMAVLHGCHSGDKARDRGIWIHVATSGHPQLARARITNLRSQNWPQPSPLTLLAPDDLYEVQKEARQRLQEQIPTPGAARVAYRLSIFRHPFRRDHALEVANEPSPGVIFDQLVGPWIEQIETNRYRLSPLLHGSAEKVFSRSERVQLHRATAEALLRSHELDVSELDGILFHGLFGEVPRAMIAAWQALDNIPAVHRAYVCNLLVWIAALKLKPGERLFEGDSRASLFGRMCQFVVAEHAASSEIAQKVAYAWEAEFGHARDLASELIESATRYAFLYKVLMAVNVPFPVRRTLSWLVELLRTYGSGLVPSSIMDRVPADVRRRVRMPDKPTDREFQMLFVFTIVQRCREPEDVEAYLRALSEIPTSDMQLVLSSLEEEWHLPIMLLDRAIVQSTERTANSATAENVISYARTLASKTGSTSLLAAAFRARATLMCERLGDPDAALVALQDGIDEIGSPHPIIVEYWARALFDKQEYGEAVSVWKSALVGWKGGEYMRVYAFRDAGVAAARIGEWQEAAQLFLEAERLIPDESSRGNSVGLRIEIAHARWKAGDHAGAVAKYAEALEKLERLPDPLVDLESFTLQKRAGHAIFWSLTNIRGGEFSSESSVVEPVPGMASGESNNEQIRELPLQPLDLTWLLLATLEREVEAGDMVWNRVKSRRFDSPGLAFQLANEAFSRALRKCELLDLVTLAGATLQATQMVSELYAVGRNLLDDLPADADLSRLPANSESRKVLSMLSLGVLTHLAGADIESLPIQRWKEDARRLWGDLPLTDKWFEVLAHAATKKFSAVWSILRAEDPLAPLEHLAAVIIAACDSNPDRCFYGQLSVFDYSRKTIWSRDVALALEELVTRRWKYIIQEQRIALLSPKLTIPAVHSALESGSTGFTKVAQVLKAAYSGVNIRVPSETMANLSAWASGQGRLE